MRLDTRKPAFWFCDHVRLKPACLATRTRYNVEGLHSKRVANILSRRRWLIRLIGCTVWSGLALFVCIQLSRSPYGFGAYGIVNQRGCIRAFAARIHKVKMYMYTQWA